MNLDDLKQSLLAILTAGPEWIPVESRLPTMFKNVLVLGTLRATSERGVMTARRWTGYQGPDARHDEIGGVWDWLTESDRSLTDVTHWLPMPSMPAARDGAA